ncbi:MAG: phage terminase large subunit family protein [Kiritimatiellae bacterium]|nr:phage terminase large subunit family protein [Kiritimatiellia bacterium]
MRHLKQTIAPDERAANVPRATPASPVLPAKAKAAAEEAATASGKKAYITKKTLQAARDARKISEAEYNFIETAGRGRRNSTRYRRIIEKVRAWIAAKSARRQGASSADRVAALVAKRNEIGEIPAPRHPRVVARCRYDLPLFGWLFCRQVLDHKPSPVIRERLVDKIQAVILHGGQLAVEIYRGGGKTTWLAIGIVWGILYGHCDFPLNIAASHPLAKAVRKIIFNILATSDEILADFPAVPTALRKMNGAVQKGLSLTYNGENVGFISSDAFLRLPMLKGGDGAPLEPACGAVMACRGVGASVRGLNIDGKRPDLALIDDPQTQKDAASSAAIQRIDDYIHADVLNLAANTETISGFIAITPQRVGDLAQRIADRTIHPNWSVTKCPFLLTLPEDFDALAGEFCEAFNIDAANNDFRRTGSRAWYIANRERLAAATPADPLAYDPRMEEDAIHHALVKYASSGRDAFYAEYQLIVKREEHAFILTPDTVLSRVRKGVEMRTIPDGTVLVVAATDINPSYALSTLVCAFDVKLTGFIPLYRVEPIRVAGFTNDTEFSAHLFDALMRHARDIAAQGVKIDRWGIDAGGRQFDAVTRFAPLARGIVCAGEATAMLGRAGRNWNPYVRSRVRSAMNGTVRCRDMQGRTWLAFNADEKKEQVQRAFSSEPGAPGGLSLFDSGARHVDFAIQMTNERIRTKTKIASNDGLDRWAIVWESKDPHDLLDCGAMCYALAADENLTGAGAPIRTVKQWTF